MRFPLPMPCWCYERIMWRRRARHAKIGVQGFAAQRAASTTPADSESPPLEVDADSDDRGRLFRLKADKRSKSMMNSILTIARAPAAAHAPRTATTAEQRDECAPPHSITSSARESSVDGTSRPSTFAVV